MDFGWRARRVHFTAFDLCFFGVLYRITGIGFERHICTDQKGFATRENAIKQNLATILHAMDEILRHITETGASSQTLKMYCSAEQ